MAREGGGTRGVVWKRREERGVTGVYRGGSDWGGAHGTRERTANMARMVATLDVSRLSGWLNTTVHCQIKKRGCDVR